MKNSNLDLHEGSVRIYYHGGNAIQLYLSDEEVQKYDNKKVCKVIEPYCEITKKRCMYISTELILYAICEVLYA